MSLIAGNHVFGRPGCRESRLWSPGIRNRVIGRRGIASLDTGNLMFARRASRIWYVRKKPSRLLDLEVSLPENKGIAALLDDADELLALLLELDPLLSVAVAMVC